MANNYKDNATSGYHQLSEVYTQYMKDGKLSDKQKAYYEPILTDLAKQLEGFTHKEQKAFWYLWWKRDTMKKIFALALSLVLTLGVMADDITAFKDFVEDVLQQIK